MGKAVLVDRPVVTNQQINSVVTDGSVVEKEFLYYALSVRRDEIFRLGSGGSTVPILKKSGFERLRIRLPALDEQRRIAAILGALDDKIELNRKINRTLEEMAQAIFKSWFIDFDGHDDLVDSEIGPIPRTWELAALGDVTSKIGSGATPRGGSEVYLTEGVNLIRSQNVYDHEFSWPGLVAITDEAADALRGVTVQRDDVLINITGDSILRTCVVDPAVLPARVNQHVAILRASRVPARYLHLWVVRAFMKDYLIGHSAGATRNAITKGHLAGAPIIVPPSHILDKFSAAVGPLFARVDANSAESRTLTALRDTLLPKLISGELRVPEEAVLARKDAKSQRGSL
jgi:type I restriction enzyme S subunit